jgi:hypothetical protein
MRKSKYTDEQIIGFIKQLDGGVPAAEVCRKGGFSAGTLGATRLEGSPRLRLLAKAIESLAGIPVNLRGEIFACVAKKRSLGSSSVATKDPF